MPPALATVERLAGASRPGWRTLSGITLVLLLGLLSPQTLWQATPHTARTAAPAPRAPAHADFGPAEGVSADARRVADWITSSGDNGLRDVVIVDKRAARVFVFNRHGQLQAETHALLGAAPGDLTVPGIGNRPISEVQLHERTTPAGRFVAEPGMNTQGEDVVWVDYDAAVSMHRVRTTHPAEHRLQRLASPGIDDNRISYGCINLPVQFYEAQLRPRVHNGGPGAVIYVLPEVLPLHQVFAIPGPA